MQCGQVHGSPFEEEKFSNGSRPGVLPVDILVSLFAFDGRLFKELYEAKMSCSNVAQWSDFFQSIIAGVSRFLIASNSGSMYSCENTIYFLSDTWKRIERIIRRAGRISENTNQNAENFQLKVQKMLKIL